MIPLFLIVSGCQTNKKFDNYDIDVLQIIPTLDNISVEAKKELNNVCGNNKDNIVIKCPALYEYLNKANIVKEKILILKEELKNAKT